MLYCDGCCEDETASNCCRLFYTATVVVRMKLSIDLDMFRAVQERRQEQLLEVIGRQANVNTLIYTSMDDICNVHK